MGHRLQEKLRRKAVAEVIRDLRKQHAVKKSVARESADKILIELLDAVTKSIARFNEVMEKAVIKSHLDSLREGHRRDLITILSKGSGRVKKDTAEKILDELGA